jgi:MFS family permease
MTFKISYRFRVMILLYFLILITYLDRITISIVGVRIKSAFHLSNTQFGWVLSAFILAYAIFEIPTGLVGDKIGQRKVLLRIVICWSVFTALTGAANGLIFPILPMWKEVATVQAPARRCTGMTVPMLDFQQRLLRKYTSHRIHHTASDRFR